MAVSTLKKIPLLPTLYRSVRDVHRSLTFGKDYRAFRKRACGAWGSEPRFRISWSDRWPCLYDNRGSIPFEPHYLYHPAWAARVLAQTRPARHVDVSSTLAFITTVSAFIPIDYYEWRPPKLGLSNLKTDHADLMALPFADDSLMSLSCMHTIEHVGLGRYGDPIDPDGDLKAIAELKRVLAPGGDLLFVVPIGTPRIRYNANRVYSYDQVRGYFADMQMAEFALILEDASGLVYGASKEVVDKQNEGCGCFWFRKV
jgi:SAM-dependent methyltransferase